MLFANLGITFIVYVGVKTYQHCCSTKQALITAHQTSAVTNDTDDSSNEKSSSDKHNHHFTVSSAGVGLSLVGYAYPPFIPVSVAIISYSTVPIIDTAIHTLTKEQRVRNDTLTATTGLLALGLNQYFAGAIEAWVYHFGDKMVAKTKDTSEKILTNVFERQPTKVWILKDDLEIEVPLESVHIQDTVIVNTGAVIPVDGTIQTGMAVIDQHALTGEAIPVEKMAGDKVFASTLVISGKIYLQVEKAGQETMVSKLGDLLNHTANFKTSLQLEGEKWADRVSLPLLISSIVLTPAIGLSAAGAILISSPTNTIRILTSMLTLNHLNVITSKGVLVKDGRALEQAPKVDTILFDKTGTLTTDQPEVGDIITCAELSEAQILTYAASVERRLAHPIANAILNAAQAHALELLNIDDANYKVGYGITVQYQAQTIQVGSVRFMDTENIVLPERIQQAKQYADEQGYSLILIAVDKQIKGALELRPQVRPEVKSILTELKTKGIQHIAIVSGDHQQATRKLAESLGIENYFYEVLPQEKAALVEQLQQQGHTVCFVGDGINDAIAMKRANVSVSLTGASSIATDMAQIVLLDGSLKQFTQIFKVSHQLDKSLRNSLFFWAGYGVTNFSAVLTLKYSLTRSVVLFTGVFALGVGHAMLPLRELETNDEELQPIEATS